MSAASLLGLVFVPGCVFVGSLFGPKVLEKSKEQTPPWVSVKPSHHRLPIERKAEA